MPLTNVSSVQSVGGFVLNRTGSEFSGFYGLNHSDTTAHTKHCAHQPFITPNGISSTNIFTRSPWLSITTLISL